MFLFSCLCKQPRSKLQRVWDFVVDALEKKKLRLEASQEGRSNNLFFAFSVVFSSQKVVVDKVNIGSCRRCVTTFDRIRKTVDWHRYLLVGVVLIAQRQKRW